MADGTNAGPPKSPPEEWLLQFFEYGHLPPPLQKASQPFCDIAHWVESTFPRNPERTVTLRKLLEAKDAAVRTILAEQTRPT